MPFAISLKADNDSARQIHALWDRVAQFEDRPSMRELDYPPHVTLAIYDDLDVGEAAAALAGAVRTEEAVAMTFQNIGVFTGPPLVLYAVPEPNLALARIHQKIHEAILPSRCRLHYRPGSWVPHCTLGMRISRRFKAQALAFARTPVAPATVVFDAADCVAFHPVKVFKEHRLPRA